MLLMSGKRLWVMESREGPAHLLKQRLPVAVDDLVAVLAGETECGLKSVGNYVVADSFVVAAGTACPACQKAAQHE